MRTMTRTALASALAFPLLAAVVTSPSVAAPPERYSVSHESFGAEVQVIGELDGLSGNVHQVILRADTAPGEGYVAVSSYLCPDGIQDPWMTDEDGVPLCEYVGNASAMPTTETFTLANRLSSGHLSGVYELQRWDEEASVSVTVGVMEADLYLTASGVTSKYRSTEVVTDPATGYSYRGTRTGTSREGVVTGTIDDLPVQSIGGRIATGTFKATSRIPAEG